MTSAALAAISPGSATVPGPRLDSGAIRRGFDSALRAATARSPGLAGGEQSPRAQAREAVSQLVSAALVLPALASLRGGAFSEGAFAPGVGERRFGPLLDREIADRVVHAANFPLIDAIVDRWPQLGASR